MKKDEDEDCADGDVNDDDQSSSNVDLNPNYGFTAALVPGHRRCGRCLGSRFLAAGAEERLTMSFGEV